MEAWTYDEKIIDNFKKFVKSIEHNLVNKNKIWFWAIYFDEDTGYFMKKIFFWI
jgi:hypothetical protein